MIYAPIFGFVSGAGKEHPRDFHQARDSASIEFFKPLILNDNIRRMLALQDPVPSATFLRRSRHFAAIFASLRGNSVMHCTKQEGGPGV
jgi:hypothetical protein